MDAYDFEAAKRLKLLREERNLSLSQLSKESKISKSSLCQYENAKAEPSLTTIKKLARYYGVTLEWISGKSKINESKYSVTNEYAVILKKLQKNGVGLEKLDSIINLLS